METSIWGAFARRQKPLRRQVLWCESAMHQVKPHDEHSSPQKVAALPQKDGCKNRFSRQIASLFSEQVENVLAASSWQTARIAQRMLAKLCF
jgi:hypothetical protein